LISLGEDGNQFIRIAKVTKLADLLLRFNTFDDHVVSIHPITYSESRALSCVAITSSGYRLYFTTNDSSFSYRLKAGRSYVAPTCLKLMHVLQPPPITTSQQGAKIHEAFYFNGLTVASQSIEDIDRILVFAPHPGVITQSKTKAMSEYASHYEIEGRTWAISESPSIQHDAIMHEKHFPNFHMNELSSQFEFSYRKIYLLTNGGLTTLLKLRPVDLFMQLLNGTNDIKAFQEFFHSFGSDQCCAMCLAIICDHPTISQGDFSVQQNIVNFAKRLYFEMSGVPSISELQSMHNVAVNGPLGIPLSTKELLYSSKHNGLVIYVTRILRPVWKQKLVNDNREATFNVEMLVGVQLKLQALVRFLKQ
jgi:nuclear pore complex protein Nup155